MNLKNIVLGKKTCPRCRGKATVQCKSCKGKGKYGFPHKLECRRCEGTGELQCPNCKGKGKISR